MREAWYFGFGVIAATAGVAAPLTAMTISQFTSWHPRRGPFTSS
jgi:hypothetical protein